MYFISARVSIHRYAVLVDSYTGYWVLLSIETVKKVLNILLY